MPTASQSNLAYNHLAGLATQPTGGTYVSITNSFSGTLPTYDNAGTGSGTYNFGLTNRSLFRNGSDNSICGNTLTYLATPIVGSASAINSAGFTANWTAVANASSYDVNVYTYPGGVLTGTSPYNVSGQATAS